MKLLITVFVVTFVVACGSDEVPVERNNQTGNSPDAGMDAGSSETELALREIYTGVCEKAFECCTETQARSLAGVSEAAACAEGALQPYSTLTAGSLDDALERGSVELDVSNSNACREAVAQTTCDAWTTTDPFVLSGACDGLITPQLNENDPCSYDFECRTGLCIATGSRGTICATLVAEGEACDPADARICDEGLACDEFASFECVSLLEDGRSCISDEECASGRCDVGPSGTNECIGAGPLCQASGT